MALAVLTGSLTVGSSSTATPDGGFAIAGLEGVTAQGAKAMIDSFDSAEGPYGAVERGASAEVLSNGPITIQSAVHGSLRSTTSGVTIKPQALVTGSIVAGTMVANKGTVNGPITPNSPTPPIQAVNPAACTPFSPATGISGGFTYDPSQGDLIVNGKTTATLAAGAYCFHDLILSGGATLAADGPVTIHLTGQLKASGTSCLNPSNIPARVRISSSYNGTDGIRFSGNAAASVSVFAPQTSVSVVGNAQLYGAALGRTLHLTGNAGVHYDVALSRQGPSPAPVNQPPVVSAGPNQSVTMAAAVTLAGIVTDDGHPGPPAALTAVWSQDAGPSPALITAPTTGATSARFVSPGTYTLRLTANDGALSATATTQITVVDGAPTLAPISDRTIPLGTTFSTRLAADDGNPNDTLTYHLDAAPPGASFFPVPVIRWTPQAGDVGTHVFTARVTDGFGHSDSRTFQVTVTAANRPPVLGAQADQAVATGAAFSHTLTATDPDPGDTLTYALVSGPAGLTVNGHALSWNPVPNVPGSHLVTVSVADASGLIDVGQFTLSVFGVTPPAAIDDDYEVPLGQTLQVPAAGVLANDLDPDGTGLAANLVTGPDKGSLLGLNTDGSFTYVAPPALSGPVLDVARALEWASGAPVQEGSSPPLVVDVAGDATPEIVVFSNNSVHVIRGDTGAVVFAASNLPPSQTGGVNCSLFGMGLARYAAADIDDDGQVEIVLPAQCAGDAGPVFAAGAADRAVALVHDPAQPEFYRVKWLTPPLSESPGPWMTAQTNFTIARLAPAEAPSVLFGKTFQGGPSCANVRSAFAASTCRIVFALDGASGSVNRVYHSTPAEPASAHGYGNGGNLANGGFMAPVVADVDNDGDLDVLYEGSLWAANGLLTRQFDGTSATAPATLSSVVVNLDGDPEMEIVALESYGTFGAGGLSAWDVSGQPIWRLPTPRTTVPTNLTVADVDRDGLPEIMFGLYDGLWIIDIRGGVKWLRNLQTPADGGAFSFFSGGGTNFPVYDLNGDGVPEVIVQYGKNTIRFLRGDTGEDQTSWSYPATSYSNSGSAQAPIVADVDGSGQASVVWYHDVNLNGTGFLQVLRGDTLSWRPAPAHFNQSAYWETNVGGDGSVPTTYVRHTADPSTNIFGHQPQAPYAAGFVPSEETSFTYQASTAGGGASTPARARITLRPVNRPPRFTTKPPKFWASFSMEYAAHAVDPDPGDTVTYARVLTTGNSPSVTVNAATGLTQISGLFGGDIGIIISATDSQGATIYQAFTMRQSAGFATVPDVIGSTEAAATASVLGAQLAVGDVVRQFNAAAAGTVLFQLPLGGESRPQGETVDLTVSLGPPPVVVPNVVGQAATAATTALAAAGFSAQTITAFSNTVAAGIVMTQLPAAGTTASPDPGAPVALTVSAGNGLTLTLDRAVTTADQPIVARPAAFDESGQPTALPFLVYTIEPAQTPYLGAPPSVSGTTITPDPATLGAFRVTATDVANARSASADFAVLPPRIPGRTTNGALFSHLAEVLEQLSALREPLRSARAANDEPQMTALLQQFVTLWRTVDPDDLRLAHPVVTPDQFVPTLDMVAGAPTADDVLSREVLQDAAVDLAAWTDALKNGGTSLSALQALADTFSTRAARLGGIRISRHGGISNLSLYARLMAHEIPAFYEALSEELAELTGMPPRPPAFPLAAQLNLDDPLPTRPPVALLAGLGIGAAMQGSPGSLSELLVTEAVDYVVEKILNETVQVYANAKKFAVDVMKQGAYTAAAVAVAGELRAFLQGQDISEAVSGASLSFRVFQSAPAWIEAPAAPDVTANVVMFIGPDLFEAVTAGGSNLIKKIQDGYNKNIDPHTNPDRYRDADEITSDLIAFKNTVKEQLDNVSTLVAKQAELVFQSPSEQLAGCVFTSDPACRQLIYPDGIQPVYTYSPPPGFGSLGGLPVPIVVLVYNAATGVMYFGTPSFLPCSVLSGSPMQVQCPNNPPFTP